MIDPASGNRRREVVAILILTLLGAALRLASFERLGFQHFDEGIYALAGFWSLSPDGLWSLSPDAIAYAPPGFPILVGLAYTGFGVSDLAAIAVSLLAGIATIPVVGWLGRRTFGPGSGAVAAAFAAISGPHAAFSRMALTDAPMLLAWLLAIGLGARFLERPTIGRSIALGLAVGLAQNLKYNGWLSGAIVGLAAILDLIAARPLEPRRVVKVLGQGALAGVVAGLTYLPWFLFVERHHGYGALLEHHRSYLGGISTWLPRLRLQLAQAIALSGGPAWGASAWGLAWIGRAFVAEDRARWGSIPRRIRPVLAIAASLFFAGGLIAIAAGPELGWWVGLIGLPWLLLDPRPGPRILGLGWVLMTVLSPFYHPYARLWLPLHAHGWLLMGGGVASLTRFPELFRLPGHFSRVGKTFWIGGLVILIGDCAIFGADRPRVLPGLLGPSDSIRTIVGSVENLIETSGSPVAALQTFARPPVLFYLALGGRVRGLPLEGVGPLLRPIANRTPALLDGLQLRQEGNPEAIVEQLRSSWRVVREFEDRPGPPTLLDVDPNAAFGPSAAERVWFLLLEPAAGPPESFR